MTIWVNGEGESRAAARDGQWARMRRDLSTPDRVWTRRVGRRRSRRWPIRPTRHGAPHIATSSARTHDHCRPVGGRCACGRCARTSNSIHAGAADDDIATTIWFSSGASVGLMPDRRSDIRPHVASPALSITSSSRRSAIARRASSAEASAHHLRGEPPKPAQHGPDTLGPKRKGTLPLLRYDAEEPGQRLVCGPVSEPQFVSHGGPGVPDRLWSELLRAPTPPFAGRAGDALVPRMTMPRRSGHRGIVEFESGDWC